MPTTTAAPIITLAATSRGSIRTADVAGTDWDREPVRTTCWHYVTEDQAHYCACGEHSCGEPRCIDDHLAVCADGAALEAFYATH